MAIEDVDDDDDIINASLNHSRSISNGKITPKVFYLKH
jgi:hypothetical protein